MKQLALIPLLFFCAGKEARAEYYQPQYKPSPPPVVCPAPLPEEKLHPEKATARAGYLHLFQSSDKAQSGFYARTEDGTLRRVKFDAAFGFAPKDGRGFFTAEALSDLTKEYGVWMDGPSAPDAKTIKDIQAAIAKVPALALELTHLPAPHSRVYQKKSGEIYIRGKDGSFVEVKPGSNGGTSINKSDDQVDDADRRQALLHFSHSLENHPELLTTGKGGLFAVTREGRFGHIKLDQNGNLRSASSFSDTVVNSYIAYQQERLAEGTLETSEKAIVEKFLLTEVADRLTLKPFEDFEGLFVSKKGSMYGALSDGSLRFLKPHPTAILTAVDMPAGSIVPESTINAYSRWLTDVRDAGKLNAEQLEVASQVFLHQALVTGEEKGIYPLPLLYRAKLPDGVRYYFALRNGNPKRHGRLMPVNVQIVDQNGEFNRRGSKVRTQKAQWLVQVPQMGKYRIHDVKDLSMNEFPAGINPTQVEGILSGHTEEELIAIGYINNIRAQTGLEPLKPAVDLLPMARNNSILQTRLGLGHHAGNGSEIAHHGPSDPYTCVYGGGGTTGWNNSSGHLGLMVGSFTHVGLSRVGNSWTAVFANRRP